MAVPRRGVAKRIQSATTFRDFGASSLVPTKGSLNPRKGSRIRNAAIHNPHSRW